MKTLMHLKHLKTTSLTQLTLSLTALLLLLNASFFQLFWTAMVKIDQPNIGFMLSVPLFVFSVLLLLLTIPSTKYLIKPIFILLIMISSLVFIATYLYGVVIDSEMIENMMQTDSRELLSYFNFKSFTLFTLTALIPILYITTVKIVYRSFWFELYRKLLLITLAIATILVIAFFYYENYAAVGRNNRQLKNYIIPTQVLSSSYKYIRNHYWQSPLHYQSLGLDAKVERVPSTTSKNVTVLVVGETARAMNYQLNGYPRATNAFTQPLAVNSFQHFSACGTATAISVPCMFSQLTRLQFDRAKAEAQDNALDIIQRAGVNVVWLDNDSGCKGVCNNIPTLIQSTDPVNPLCDGEYCFDEVVLTELAKQLEQIETQETLIVIHLIGSHGPTYYRRYPPEHRHFTPDCQTSDIQNCTAEQLVNSYDNTILYTDYVVSQVIEQLTNKTAAFQSSMLYLSDHGESLGENRLFLHGFPYAFAPAEQTEIPLLTWFSDNSLLANPLSQQCIADKAVNEVYSHDNLFDTLLGLTAINSTVYNKQQDIFADCINAAVVKTPIETKTSELAL